MIKTYMENDQVTSPTLEEIAEQKKLNTDLYQYKPTSGLRYLEFMYRVGILTGNGKEKKSNDIVWNQDLVK